MTDKINRADTPDAARMLYCGVCTTPNQCTMGHCVLGNPIPPAALAAPSPDSSGETGEDFEGFARAWHNAVDAITGLMGLGGGMGANEAVDAVRAALATPEQKPGMVTEDGIADLLEELDRGVVETGMHDDNSTSLYDVDGASEVMWRAAQAIRALIVRTAIEVTS